MLNILVPTDFSDLAKVALKYAVKIASKLDAQITLVHVLEMQHAVSASMRSRLKVIEGELAAQNEHALEKVVNDISRRTTLSKPIEYKVLSGTSFTETLNKEARRLKSGLIVMGTHGATGLKKAMFGSNTNAVIQASNVPVLAVPEKADFKSFRNIVYATNLKKLERELKMLIPYVTEFNATVHVLHIVPEGSDVEAIEAKIDKAIAKLKYNNVATLVLVDNDIEGAINQYVNTSKAELLTMFTHELNFLERLFDTSITRSMAFHSKVPLLAFKQK